MNSKVRPAVTVGELRELLKDLPSEMLVVQARDVEGNGYLPLMGIDTGLYSPEADMVLSEAHAALLPANPHSVVCLRPAHDWQHAQMIADARRTRKTGK